MPSMPSLSISSWPAVLPPPVTKLKTPSGRPASLHISYSFRPIQRRGARRLEHDGVAGDERAAGGTGREREREVERRDDGPDAVRPQHAGVSLVGAERAHLLFEAVVRLDLVAVVRHQVRRLFDVADAFEAVLAGLVAHDARTAPSGDCGSRRPPRAPSRRARATAALPTRARPRARRQPPPSRARARRSGSGRGSTGCRSGSRRRTSSPAVTGCPLMNIGCVWPNCFLTSTMAASSARCRSTICSALIVL